MEEKYGVDVAGLALFLDKEVTLEKINAVAVDDSQNNDKSVTG